MWEFCNIFIFPITTETNSFVDGGLNNVLLSFGMDLIN